jgi:hypothetical protein
LLKKRFSWGSGWTPIGETILHMFIFGKKKIFKYLFLQICKPVSIKFCVNYPCVKGIQGCSNKRASPIQRRDNHKKCKNRDIIDFINKNY